MRLLAASIILAFIPSVLANFDAGIEKLMFDIHSVEIDAIGIAVTINPVGRQYAHEIVRVTTQEGRGYLVRVQENNLSTTYLVDNTATFTVDLLDQVYVVKSHEIQPVGEVQLASYFAAVCVSTSRLNGVFISVSCHRAKEVIETNRGVVSR